MGLSKSLEGFTMESYKNSISEDFREDIGRIDLTFVKKALVLLKIVFTIAC